MAADNATKNITLPQGSDLRECYACALKLNANGQVIPTTTITDVVIGFLASIPPAATVGLGVSVTLVQPGGIGKARAGAAITAGHIIHPDATAAKNGKVLGKAVLATNDYGIGYALEAATAEDDIIEVLLHTVDG